MELEYKVRYERIDGRFFVTDWDNYSGASRFFQGLKNEKVKTTVWAELCYASIEEDAPDEVHVVDDFERRVVEIMGKKIVV